MPMSLQILLTSGQVAGPWKMKPVVARKEWAECGSCPPFWSWPTIMVANERQCGSLGSVQLTWKAPIVDLIINWGLVFLALTYIGFSFLFFGSLPHKALQPSCQESSVLKMHCALVNHLHSRTLWYEVCGFCHVHQMFVTGLTATVASVDGIWYSLSRWLSVPFVRCCVPTTSLVDLARQSECIL